jgi:hypothetical protein
MHTWGIVVTCVIRMKPRGLKDFYTFGAREVKELAPNVFTHAAPTDDLGTVCVRANDHADLCGFLADLLDGEAPVQRTDAVMPKADEPPLGDWPTVTEAAEIAGTDKKNITTHCNSGTLNCVEKGRKRRIDPISLVNWIRANPDICHRKCFMILSY